MVFFLFFFSLDEKRFETHRCREYDSYSRFIIYIYIYIYIFIYIYNYICVYVCVFPLRGSSLLKELRLRISNSKGVESK